MPTVYLTFDDGPNPTATPELLDVLARHQVSGHVLRHRQAHHPRHRADRAPHVRRRVTRWRIHWHSRELMFKGPTYVASAIQEAAARLELLTGHQACRASVRTPAIAASR